MSSWHKDLIELYWAYSHIVQPTRLEGAPDLIVEIISRDSQSRDRREKYQEYEKGGVKEYWIVEPLSSTFEVYQLQGKKFQKIDDVAGVFTSTVLPRFRLKSALLWKHPLPKVAAVLKQMK